MSNPSHSRSRRGVAYRASVLAAAALLAVPATSGADVLQATWASPVSGNWDYLQWAGIPDYPNNYTDTYDTFITATGSPYTLSITAPAVVNSITVTSPDATLLLNVPSYQNNYYGIRAINGINLTAGTFRLQNGGLSDQAITAAPSASVLIAPGAGNGLYLGSITLDADATYSPQNGGFAHFYGDFALLNGHALTLKGSLDFAQIPHVAGNGTLVLDNGSVIGNGAGIRLYGTPSVFDPGITVTAGAAGGVISAIDPAVPATMNGTFWSRTPGATLGISGSWTSLGALRITDGTLDLAVPVSTPVLNNSVVQTGGSLVLHGPVDNAGYTLTPAGSTTLASTLTGGTLAATSAYPHLTVSNGTLDSVDLRSDLLATGPVTLANTQLNGHTLSLQNGAQLTLAGSLTTPGQITVSPPTLSYSVSGVIAAAPAVTLGPALTVTVTGANARLTTSGAGASLVNQGTITASSTDLAVGGTFLNEGAIQVGAAARLTVSGPTVTNTGAISVSPGSVLYIGGGAAGTAAGTFSNTGTITATDAAVTFDNTWSNTGSVSLAGGSLTLSGTASPAGTFYATGTAVRLLGPAPTAGSLADCPVTVAAPYTSAQLLSVPLTSTSSVTLAAGSAVDNASYTLPLSASAAPWFLAGGSITGGSISSPDATPLTAATGSSTLASLSATVPIVVSPKATLTLSSVTLGAPLAVSAGSSATLTNTTANNSTITLAGSLTAGDFPLGVVAAAPGSSLTFAGPIANLAAVTADAATLTATNTAYAPADFRAAPATITSSTYRIGPGATLDLTGDDLHLPNSNSFGLAGGTITGGTISSDLSATGGSSTLSSTTLASTLTISGAVVTAGPSFSLAGGIVRFATNGTLSVPSGTLAGIGSVIFDSTSTAAPAVGGPATGLTVGPEITITTGPNLASTPGAPSPLIGSSFAPLVNQGTISSRTPGRVLTLSTNALTNTGTIEARDGGILRLSGSFTPTSLASVSTTNGGVAYVVNTLNSLNSTLALSSSHNIGLSGGTLRSGTVTSADGTPLTIYPYLSPVTTIASTITGASVLTPVSVLAGATLAVTNSTLSSAITASGATVNLNGSYSLPGGLTLSSGSTANYNGTATGTIGPISLADSTLTLNASLDLAGSPAVTLSPTSTLTVAGVANTFSNSYSAATLSNATITGGGTVSLNYGYLSGPALSNVTLAGATSLSVASPTYHAEVRNGLTMNGGRISLANGPVDLRLDSLAGSGEIVFDGPASNSTVGPRLSSSNFNLPAGFTARTGSAGGFLGVNTMAGLVSAQTPGTTFTLGAISVTGTVEARNGATAILSSSTSFGSTVLAPNGYGYSLLTGTYNVFDNSTLSINYGGFLYANAAALTLSGPDATVFGIQYLNANSGSLTLTSGKKLTLPAPSFTNSGSLTLGPAAALKLTGTLANPGTLFLAGGFLLLDYSSTSPIDSLRNDLLTGHLTTPLPDTAVAYFEAAQLGLTTYAGLAVDTTTLLTRLTVPGDANLDGVVDADDYALLDRSLARSLANPHWMDGDFDYDGQITADDYLLIDSSYLRQQGGTPSPAFLAARESRFGAAYVSQLLTSVPEPSTLGLLFTTSLPLLSRRTRSRRKSH